MFSFLVALFVGSQFGFNLCCHWTNIVVKNGTWCCGNEGSQRDTGDNNTAPPIGAGTPTIDFSPTSSTSNTGSPTTPVVTHPPKPPVGDCPCGNFMDGMETAPNKPKERILSQDIYGTGELNRPWLVHIKIIKDSRKTIECTGSLLNK